MKRLARVWPPLVGAALVLALWEAACHVFHVPLYVLPPPSAVAVALRDNAGLLVPAAWSTLSTALVALLAACVLGSGLAILVSLQPSLERAVQPLAAALQATPIVAIAPLAVIWAGLAHPERAVFGLATLAAIFPMFSGTLAGLHDADPDLERLLDLYGAGRWARFLRLRLPSAARHVVQALTLAAGLSVVGAVVAEFVAGTGGAQGLAWRILEASNRLQMAKVFAALMILAVMGAGLVAAVQFAGNAYLRRREGRR